MDRKGQRRAKPRESKKNKTRKVLLDVVFVIVAIVIIRLWVIEANVIPSGSMKETLLVGDYILAEKITFLFREPRPGDIVTFVYPYRRMKAGEAVRFFLRFILKESPTGPRLIIKRIVGGPGDLIALENDVLYRNGKPVREPYLKDGAGTWLGSELPNPYRVPAGHYFVMGDNRYDSADSRFIGPVPRKYITGRAVIIYFSLAPTFCPRHGAPAVKTADGWACATGGEELKPWWDFSPAGKWRFDERIRWSRLGKLVNYRN